MVKVPPGWQRWMAWIGLAGALAIVGEWTWHLWHSVPPIARSDHLMALWRVAAMVEQGEWGRVAAWVVEFGGGHIIGYARSLQLVNLLFFHYSGAFIKVAAIVTFALTWAALAWALLRTLGFGLANCILLPWAAWLVCSPVLANLVTWPEAAPAFLCTTLLVALLVPWLGGASRAAVVGGTVAMAFTNGSGFVFLPAALAVQLRRRQAVFMAVLLAAAFGLLLLALWIIRVLDIQPSAGQPHSAVNLVMAVHSLRVFMAHPAFFVQYFLALLALPFAPFRVVEIWPWGLAVVAYTVLVLAWTDHTRPGPQRGWLVMAYFGLLAAGSVALGRYGYIDMSNTANAVITSHYAAVVLPLHAALGALTLLLVREGPPMRRTAIAALAVILAGGVIWKRQGVDRDFSHGYRTEMAIQFGSSNWNIYAAAASLGDPSVGQIAVLRIYPELKAWGKYPELTNDLVVDPSSIGVATARRQEHAACGRVHAFAPDTRYAWAGRFTPDAFLYTPGEVPFTRAVGYLDCNAEFVVMFGRDGKAQCVARPGPLATAFTEPELKSRPGMGDRSFDFSCPGGDAASVWAFDRARRLLVEVPRAP